MLFYWQFRDLGLSQTLPRGISVWVSHPSATGCEYLEGGQGQHTAETLCCQATEASLPWTGVSVPVGIPEVALNLRMPLIANRYQNINCILFSYKFTMRRHWVSQ